ncbi:Uu.00g035100.m01.CDS01 [Anthostomella pinea]|uniref:Uu.00g035100.m01.CDS01 n=1 Tax=Anthostomella pinea TaxID=933095 RepID=A0AAI8YDF2_9PEZI|nr:Uu.00g035100.m01.CDS01 [Anthostomella pinea]
MYNAFASPAIARPDETPDTIVDVTTIDGFLAFVRFSEEVDGHFQTPPQEAWEVPVTAYLAMGSSYSLEKSRQQQSEQQQWDRLRRFKHETDELYATIRKHSSPPGSGFLRRWLGLHDSPSELRNRGLLALRGIYYNKLPSCSLGAFAAMVVQHCIRETLCLPSPDETALGAWRDNLLNKPEQEQLRHLFGQLFPKDNSARLGIGRDQSFSGVQENYIEVGGQFNSDTTSTLSSTNHFFHEDAISIQPPFPSTNTDSMWRTRVAYNTQQRTNQYYSPMFDPALNVFGGASPYMGQSFDPSSLALQCVPGPSSGYPAPIHPVHPMYPHPLSTPIPPDSQQRHTAHSDQRTPNLAAKLRRSPPFQLFTCFVKEFSQTELLSIDKVTTPTDDTYRAFTDDVSTHDQTEFVGDIKLHLFTPLMSTSQSVTKDPTAKGIIAAAELMFSLGNLHCLRQLEDYLILLGQRLLQPKETFETFARLVVETCVKSAPRPGIRQFCYPEATVHVDLQYTDRYLEAQLNKLSITEGSRYAPQDMDNYLPPHSLRVPSTRGTTSHHSGSQETSGLDEDEAHTPTTFSQDTDPSSKRCPYCSNVYRGQYANTSLSRHKRTSHTNTLYNCPYCLKHDKRSDNLGHHIKTQHPGMMIPKLGKKGRERPGTHTSSS